MGKTAVLSSCGMDFERSIMFRPTPPFPVVAQAKRDFTPSPPGLCVLGTFFVWEIAASGGATQHSCGGGGGGGDCPGDGGFKKVH